MIVLCILGGALALTAGVRAAFEVVVSASPTEVQVGQPLEILVRTFVPVRPDVLDVPDPREPYPGPSGLWNLLYPMMEDYPFDVVAEHEDGTEVPVTVVRDSSDSTLWRGIVALPKAGSWTVWVRNFPGRDPGSITVVRAHTGPPVSTEAGTAVVSVLLGLLGGFVVGRRWRHRLPS